MEKVFTGEAQCAREIICRCSYLSRCRIKFALPQTTIKAQSMSYSQYREKREKKYFSCELKN